MNMFKNILTTDSKDNLIDIDTLVDNRKKYLERELL